MASMLQLKRKLSFCFACRSNFQRHTTMTSAHPQTPDQVHQQHQNEHENPWESAANDRLWETSHTPSGDSTTALLNGDTNYNNANTSHNMNMNININTVTSGNNSDPSSRGFSSAVFQACHVVDMIGGASLALYAGIVELSQDRLPSIFVITLSTLILVRGILAKITKCGVSVSATISFALLLLYLSLALCLWGLSLSESTGTCLVFPLQWCHTLSSLKLAGLLVILAVFEGIRYVWIRRWMYEEATTIRDVLNQSEVSERQRRRSPWWWSSQGGTQEGPLLTLSSRSARPHWSTNDASGYHMDHGMGTPVRGTSWWPFGRRQSNDVRDDASVEYASLNEDWASRSEEDPFWWTQDDGGNRIS